MRFGRQPFIEVFINPSVILVYLSNKDAISLLCVRVHVFVTLRMRIKKTANHCVVLVNPSESLHYKPNTVYFPCHGETTRTMSFLGRLVMEHWRTKDSSKFCHERDDLIGCNREVASWHSL